MTHKIFRLVSSLFLALAVMLAGVAPALAAPVLLDPTFDGDGKVITVGINIASVYGMDIAIQTDGKIIAAGSATPDNHGDFALVRYNTNGSLDTTFDTDGIVTTDFGNNSEVGTAVALQLDGKIVVAGFSTDAISGVDDKFALARYNSDGSLDTTFDTDGKVTTFIGGADNAFAVALQSDGKIVVAGNASNGSNHDFALVRYNSNGSLDTSFDTDGIALTDFGFDSGDGAEAMALQSDGKIILAGSSFNRNTNDSDFALARYNSDGSLDTTFDTDGKVTTDFGISVLGNAITLQSDGKIVMAGSGNNGIDGDFVLARYNSNGSLDTTFDTDGKVDWDFGGQEIGNDVAIGLDSKIVVVGSTSSPLFPISSFVLARYNTNGSPDTTFDTDGVVITEFGGDDFGQAIAIQTDGKIIIGGSANLGFTNVVFALARFNVENSSSTEVTIDIKPGRFPNRIKLTSNVCNDDDNVYVAILTTPTFNALTVDVSSLQLGDPNLSGKATPIKSRITDVDRDGDKDMVLTFTLCSIVTNRALNGNSTEMVLTGRTLDDVNFTGRDSVKVVRNSYPSYP